VTNEKGEDGEQIVPVGNISETLQLEHCTGGPHPVNVLQALLPVSLLFLLWTTRGSAPCWLNDRGRGCCDCFSNASDCDSSFMVIIWYLSRIVFLGRCHTWKADQSVGLFGYVGVDVHERNDALATITSCSDKAADRGRVLYLPYSLSSVYIFISSPRSGLRVGTDVAFESY